MPTTYAIPNGRTVMDATTYTGTGAAQNIINQAGFKPDLVWVKLRSGAASNRLVDSVRGATKELYSNTTDVEYTAANGLTAFNTNGFTLGTDTGYNGNTSTYVGWQWQAGQGTTSSNTAGTISSTVSVNQTAGFSIVSFTGASGSDDTVGHGLGVAPAMVIVKTRTTNGYDWVVWNKAYSTSYYLLVNKTDALANATNYWGSAIPTSTVFGVGAGSGAKSNNLTGSTMIAYVWAEISGYSKTGTYTGNGSADGPFVYTGFRPKFILIKATSRAENWHIHDTGRNPYNLADCDLYTDSTNAETTLYNQMDILSNGFKLRATQSGTNNSGDTYVYMAFAENPFKYANAR